MDCEPVLNLAATPDEAVSIICTVFNKTISLSGSTILIILKKEQSENAVSFENTKLIPSYVRTHDVP